MRIIIMGCESDSNKYATGSPTSTSANTWTHLEQLLENYYSICRVLSQNGTWTTYSEYSNLPRKDPTIEVCAFNK